MPGGWNWYAGLKNVTTDAYTAPDGTKTADIVTGSSSIWQDVPLFLNENNYPLTFSVYIHVDSTPTLTFDNIKLVTYYCTFDDSGVISSSRQSVGADFNIKNGTFQGSSKYNGGTFLGYTSTYAGNGWYRYSMTSMPSAGGDPSPVTIVRPELYYNSSSNLTGSLIAWGLQLVKGTEPGTYLKTDGYQSIYKPVYQTGNAIYNSNSLLGISSLSAIGMSVFNYGPAALTADPVGTNTAVRLLEDTNTSKHLIYSNNITVAPYNDIYTWTVYVKGVNRSNFVFSPKINNVDYYTYFNCPNNVSTAPLSSFIVNGRNGTVVSVPAGNTAKVEYINYDYYKLTVTRAVTAGDIIQFTLGTCKPGTTQTYLGEADKGFFTWGLKIAPSFETPYVPYGTSFDIKTSYIDADDTPNLPELSARGVPDSGLCTVTNTGIIPFKGTIQLSGTFLSAGLIKDIQATWPTYYTKTGPDYILNPGKSVYFIPGPESSNYGGFNKVSLSADNGIQVVMNGTLLASQAGYTSDVAFTYKVFDKDIHSGYFNTNQPFGLSAVTDAYVLQGGDAYGRDTVDPYENTQTPGHRQIGSYNIDNDAIQINDTRQTFFNYGVNDSNLLRYSEDFANPAWQNYKGYKNITSNTYFRPDKQFFTADIIDGTASILQDVLINDPKGIYTFSCYAHVSSTSPYIKPTIWLTQTKGGEGGGALENVSAQFDTRTGKLINFNNAGTVAGYNAYSTYVGNGWYRYVVSVVGSLATNRYARAEIYYNTNLASAIDSAGSYGLTYPTTYIYTGNVTLPTGKINTGIYLDGTSNLFNNSFKTGSQDFSLAAWIKPESLTQSSIFNQGGVGGVDEIGTYCFGYNNGQICFYGDQRTIVGNAGSVPLNTWSHIALTYEVTGLESGTYRMYVNGTEVNTGDYGVGNYLTTPLQLGGYYGGIIPFKGTIDEVGIWSKKLSVQEIINLYNSASGISYDTPNFPSGASAYWNFDTYKLILWGAQFEQKGSAGDYIRTLDVPILSHRAQNRTILNAVEPNLGLPTGTTTTSAGSAYYFPIVTRNGKNIKSRRFTTNDSLIIKDSKLGYNNTNPTFTFDISGSIGSIQAVVPTVSTTVLAQISGNTSGLNINNLVNFNSSITATQNFKTANLSAQKIFATTFTRVSTQTILIPVTGLSAANVSNFLLTGNFTTTGNLTANNITITNTSYAPYASAANTTVNVLNANDILINNSLLTKNLFDYSQDFDNSVWNKGSSSIVPNIISAPDGTQTADKLKEGTTNDQHIVYQAGNESLTNNKTYTFSLYAKAGERTKISLTSYGEDFSVFDLVNGTVTNVYYPDNLLHNNTASMSSVGNGWWRCSLTLTRSCWLSGDGNQGIDNFYAIIWPTGGTTWEDRFYTGDGNSGIYIWGAQLEKGSTLTPYQRTTVTTITANNIYGRIKIDPYSNLSYNSSNQLTNTAVVDLITLGVKPSDSYSTDDTSVIRSSTGQWDNNSSENIGTLKPYFQNIFPALEYVRIQGLRAKELRILIYENIIAGERKINNSTTGSANTDGNYSGFINSQDGQSNTTRFYSTEWLGANYPALTAAGLRGGDYMWIKDRNTPLITADFNYWLLNPGLNFDTIRIHGLSNIGPRILGPGQNYYTFDKPFDQAPVKVTCRTYVCGTTALSAGQFGTDATIWQRTPEYSIYGRVSNQKSVDYRQTILQNLNFEIENNVHDNTPSIWNAGGTLYVHNVTTSILGDGHHPYGILFNGGDVTNVPQRTIIYGKPQIDPYFLTPGTWASRTSLTGALANSNGAYYPGYGLAIVGSPVTSTNHSRFSIGLFVGADETANSFEIYDYTINNFNFGKNSYIQNSIIFDGKFNSGYADNQNFPTALFYGRRGANFRVVENYFKTDNFQLSTYKTTYANGTSNPRRISHDKSVTNYSNFYYFTFEHSYNSLTPFSFGLAPWKTDGTIPELSANKHNITIYNGLRNDATDSTKYVVNTTTKSAVVSGYMVPFDLPIKSPNWSNDVTLQYNNLRSWYPHTTEYSLENLISPNELPNYNTLGYYKQISPMNSGLTSTMVFYTSATR